MSYHIQLQRDCNDIGKSREQRCAISKYSGNHDAIGAASSSMNADALANIGDDGFGSLCALYKTQFITQDMSRNSDINDECDYATQDFVKFLADASSMSEDVATLDDLFLYDVELCDVNHVYDDAKAVYDTKDAALFSDITHNFEVMSDSIISSVSAIHYHDAEDIAKNDDISDTNLGIANLRVPCSEIIDECESIMSAEKDMDGAVSGLHTLNAYMQDSDVKSDDVVASEIAVHNRDYKQEDSSVFNSEQDAQNELSSIQYRIGEMVCSLDDAVFVSDVSYAYSINVHADNVSLSDFASDVSGTTSLKMMTSQILDHMDFTRLGDNDFRIKLRPEGLGVINIKYSLNDGLIPHMHISANKMSSVALLEKHIDEFKEIIEGAFYEHKILNNHLEDVNRASWVLNRVHFDKDDVMIKLEYDMSDIFHQGDDALNRDSNSREEAVTNMDDKNDHDDSASVLEDVKIASMVALTENSDAERAYFDRRFGRGLLRSVALRYEPSMNIII